MVSTLTSSQPSVVIDANVVIAICTNEADKLTKAEAKLQEYATKGCRFYAPGVLVAECLFVFCKKLKDGVLTGPEHASAIKAFITLMAAIEPLPAVIAVSFSGQRTFVVNSVAGIQRMVFTWPWRKNWLGTPRPWS